MDVIQFVLIIRHQNLFHDGELREAPTAHLHKLHERAARHLTLAQTDGRQVFAALGDPDELLVERTETVGAHHQLHQPRARQPHTTQNILADRAAEVQVRYGKLVAEKGPELVLVQEEVHDQVEFGRVAHHGVPAALLDGVEVLAGVLAHHVDAQVLQVDMLLGREGQQQLIAQQVIVERQLAQAVTLIRHAQDPCEQHASVGLQSWHTLIIFITRACEQLVPVRYFVKDDITCRRHVRAAAHFQELQRVAVIGHQHFE